MNMFYNALSELGTKYKYISIIGKGAFGTVFKVEKNGKSYALKIIIKNNIPEESLDIVKREFEIIATLPDSTRLLKYYNFWETINYLIILTEFIDGYSLFDIYTERQKTGKTFSNRELTIIAKEVLKALVILESKNIVHRDLKLENIMFDNKRIVLIDFGLSCLLLKHDKFECKENVGTFWDPDIKIHNDPLSWKNTDTYGLGLMLWHMMTLTYARMSILTSDNIRMLRSMSDYSDELKTVIQISVGKYGAIRESAQVLLDIIS